VFLNFLKRQLSSTKTWKTVPTDDRSFAASIDTLPSVTHTRIRRRGRGSSPNRYRFGMVLLKSGQWISFHDLRCKILCGADRSKIVAQ
jgi:hypothetical protein